MQVTQASRDKLTESDRGEKTTQFEAALTSQQHVFTSP